MALAVDGVLSVSVLFDYASLLEQRLTMSSFVFFEFEMLGFTGMLSKNDLLQFSKRGLKLLNLLYIE